MEAFPISKLKTPDSNVLRTKIEWQARQIMMSRAGPQSKNIY
jgi:hypothetical protein